MPKNKKNSEDSKTTETKWTALAVTSDTHKAVKVAAGWFGPLICLIVFIGSIFQYSFSGVILA